MSKDEKKGQSSKAEGRSTSSSRAANRGQSKTVTSTNRGLVLLPPDQKEVGPGKHPIC